MIAEVEKLSRNAREIFSHFVCLACFDEARNEGGGRQSRAQGGC